MNNNYLVTALRFVVLLVAQVLIFNRISLTTGVIPYIYVSYLVLFPFKEQRIFFVVSAFFLGLSVDMFSNSGGVHAAAMVTAAYARLYLLKLILGISYENQNLKWKDITPYQKFSLILAVVACHHLVLFFLEIFNLNLLSYTLTKTLLSVIFTTLASGLIIYIFSGRKK